MTAPDAQERGVWVGEDAIRGIIMAAAPKGTLTRDAVALLAKRIAEQCRTQPEHEFRVVTYSGDSSCSYPCDTVAEVTAQMAVLTEEFPEIDFRIESRTVGPWQEWKDG